MATQVVGDLYVELDGKLSEIKRQMRQPGGYPFDPEELNKFLQRAVEGRFNENQRWREENGVIYFTLPATDGTTGPQWIERLERQGKKLSKWAKDALLSPNFKPTTGVVYNVAVLKGELYADSDRITSKIRADANRRKFVKLSAEAACLIRELFSDEEIKAMGLWRIVVFHDVIKGSGGVLFLLAACRLGDDSSLDAYGGRPGGWWLRGRGFAFALSQVSS